MSMLSVIAGAQIDEYAEFKRQQMEKFAGFSSVQQAKYDAYRKALNEQYARFMEDSWMRLSAMPAVEIEEEPKIKPIVYDYKSTTKVEEGKIDSVLSSDAIFDFIPILLKKEVIQIPEPSPQAEPIAPIEGKLTLKSRKRRYTIQSSVAH